MSSEATRTPVAPISLLSHDILLTIFKINGNMFAAEYPLRDTRNSSQVCHDWRELTVSSPSLWARQLDFDHFRLMKTDRWEREILRRAGTAPLWVKSTHPRLSPKHAYKFMLEVLNNRWEQIERIKLVLTPEKTTPRNWHPFCRSAPRLLDLDLVVTGLDYIGTSSKNQLFGDHAPSLRIFRAENCRFNPQAAWLSNLQSINIGADFTAWEILDALKMTPLLKNLRITPTRSITPGTNQVLPFVQLPNLEYIHVSSSRLQPSTYLMKHLLVSPGCSLELVFFDLTYDMDELVTKDTLTLALQPVVQFMARYLDFYKITSISMMCSPKHLQLHDREISAQKGSNIFDINFKFLSRQQQSLTHIHDTFFKTFSLPYLSKITTLNTRINYQAPHIAAAYLSFFLILPSVKTLATDQTSIRYLEEIQKDAEDTIFPNLKTVVLDEPARSYRVYGPPIFDFVVSRRHLGVAFDVLDLTRCKSDVGLILILLQDLHGLQIQWKSGGDILEYTCGSGNPLPS